jgi:hypothetical protein
MRENLALSLALTALVACGQPPVAGDSQSALPPRSEDPGQQTDAAPAGGQPTPTAGPTAKPGGGLLAEESGVEGNLSIKIRWESETVKGIPEEGQITEVYKRTAQLLCPVTSSGEASFSYFNLIDNPNSSDPFAATGSYQQWLNEECTGTLTIDDTYHFNDPTIAGPEPIVHTSGTRSFSLGDIPFTIETDLNKARTRYLFLSPSANGFQQHEAPGYPAKLVAASAAPMATMDFTLEGPIGGGKGEISVQGGMVYVDWTFTRGRQQQ